MASDSPAKHERIQRHLMRQRGAGTRTVNADFDFLFAGFSAPTSQEATPTTRPSEPAAKRRKTIADGAVVEPAKARSSVLDRRGKTRAARAKRWFVVETAGEERERRNEDVAGGDDSFVTATGVKKRGIKRPAEALEEVVSSEAAVEPACGAGEIEAKERPGKAKARGVRRRVDRAVDSVQEMHQAKAVPDAQTKWRQKHRGRQVPAEDVVKDTGSIARSQDEQPCIEAQGPKPKQKGTGRTKTGPPAKCDNDYIGIEESNGRQDDDGPKRAKSVEEPEWNSRRKRAAVVHCEDDKDGGERQVAVQKRIKRTLKNKAAKEARLDAPPPRLERVPLTETDANRSPSPRKSPEKCRKPLNAAQASGARVRGRKREEASSAAFVAEKLPRRGQKLRMEVDDDIAAAVADESVEEANAHHAEQQQQGLPVSPVCEYNASGPLKVTKQSLRKKETSLQRPRPTTSSTEDCVNPEDSIGKSKHDKPTNDEATAATRVRRGRKHREQKPEAPAVDMAAKGSSEQCAEPQQNDRPLPNVFKQSASGSSKVAGQSTFREDEASRPTTSTKQSNRKHLPSKRKTAPQADGAQPSTEKEEDIDWLFAAPDARSRPVAPKARAPKVPAVPRKIKLAEIDLDDLIANVALFA